MEISQLGEFGLIDRLTQDLENVNASTLKGVGDDCAVIRNHDTDILVTTEKDAVRILNNPYFPHRLKRSIFYVPIKVEFIDRGETEFTAGIEKTIRDSRLFKS